MLGALIIVFREVVEAGLIVGIVMAVTRGIPGRTTFIFGGLLAGLAGAGLVAAFARALSDALEGSGQEVFNASVLLLAVAMLTWHNVWMARHGRDLANDLKAVGRDVGEGRRSLGALAIVVAVAVLREGSEVVLFLYGIVLSEKPSTVALLAGGFVGLALGVGLSLLTAFGLLAIPVRHLFRVTTILIAFMAAGMATQSVAFLEQADIVTAGARTVWNTSSILSDNSVAGRMLHALFGYTAAPSQMQLAVYVAVLGVTFLLMRLLTPPPRPRPSAVLAQ